jgi:hypothetical protein
MTSDEDIDAVQAYQQDPLGFVQRIYPWREGGPLAMHEGPRAWQAESFDLIGRHLRNPATRFTPLRIAVASGHGIGKSGFIGMLSHWALSTMPDTRIVITANTEKQLLTKTWPEINKWLTLADNKAWFKPTATAVYSADPEAEKSWRADATPWSENNTEAFAGLHNEGRRIILIMDEASAIADKVWEVAEGALTDENTEIIWIAFGNPTRNTGRFRECFRQHRHLWHNRQIDSRNVEGTNKEYLAEMVQTYGEDSDIVKVRIRGMFPAMSAKQFISTTDVDAARGRHLKPEQYNFAPKILTCDPAWEGDDELVIGLRQGLSFRILATIAKNDNDLQVAAILARHEDQEQADAVFVDAGYGTGIVSAGRTMGRDWHLVWFASSSSKPGYRNKRAEMWADARDWLKAGGAIDEKDDVLYQDLIGPETVGTLDGMVQLESKKDMKKRGLPSPGRGDALALSFAFPVSAKSTGGLAARARSREAVMGYDPMEHVSAHGNAGLDYDPLSVV